MMPTKAWLQAASKRAEISREDVSTFTMNGIIRFIPVGAIISYPPLLAVTTPNTESNV